MAILEKACRQAGLSKAAAAQEHCSFSIDHDRGGVERLKT
jgi:hypothetical protein